MEIVAKAKFIRISPKKVHPLLKDLRRKKAVLVLASLRYAHTKAGKLLYKLISSAISNATNNYNLKTDNLKIKTLTVDEGPRLKRHWLRSHGSADVILKRSSHLVVVLEEIQPTASPKAKSKPISKITPPPGDKLVTDKATSDELAPNQANLDKGKIKKSGGAGLKRIFRRTTNK